MICTNNIKIQTVTCSNGCLLITLVLFITLHKLSNETTQWTTVYQVDKMTWAAVITGVVILQLWTLMKYKYETCLNVLDQIICIQQWSKSGRSSCCLVCPPADSHLQFIWVRRQIKILRLQQYFNVLKDRKKQKNVPVLHTRQKLQKLNSAVTPLGFNQSAVIQSCRATGVEKQG